MELAATISLEKYTACLHLKLNCRAIEQEPMPCSVATHDFTSSTPQTIPTMQPKSLAGMSLEDLKQKEAGLKKITSVFIGVLAVLFLAIMMLFYQQKTAVATPLLVVFLISLSSLMLNRKNLANIQEEIRNRETA